MFCGHGKTNNPNAKGQSLVLYTGISKPCGPFAPIVSTRGHDFRNNSLAYDDPLWDGDSSVFDPFKSE